MGVLLSHFFHTHHVQNAIVEVNEVVPKLKDRYHAVLIIFLLHGVGHLIPWNMFLSAIDYFTDYKIPPNCTGSDRFHKTKFFEDIELVSMFPLMVLSWGNAFIRMGKGSINRRIIGSIVLEIIIFTIMAVLAMTNISRSSCTVSLITFLLIVIINAANGVYTNAIWGAVAKFPQTYTGVVVFGNNISGTITSLLSIVFLLAQTSFQSKTIYMFIIALTVLMMCLDTHLLFPMLKYYRLHRYLTRSLVAQRQDDIYGHLIRPPYKVIFKRAYLQLINVFLVYSVTLMIFPAIITNIRPIGRTYFAEDVVMQVDNYLTFNFFAMIGSLVALFFRWPSPKYLIVPVVMRFLYIPFFLACNYQLQDVRRVVPVYIKWNWLYWLVAVTMAFTSGYFASITMQYTRNTATTEYRREVGQFAGAILVLGIFIGVMFSFAWPYLLFETSNKIDKL
ncbi:hypothetical protein Trydic_g2406 [Trypoxylus dichotomus]